MIMFRSLVFAGLSLATTLCLIGCDAGETQDTTPPAIHKSQTEGQEGDIRERYWKLVELRDQPVTFQNREPHMILKTGDQHVNGSGGCNSFHGRYALSEPERIRFTQVASTMMACAKGMDTEQEFLKVLESADSYNLQGDHLILNRARMAPLARFEAVYLR